MATGWHSVVFIDLDGTLIDGPFGSIVFPTILGELAEQSGLTVSAVRRMVVEENLRRQRTRGFSPVLAMDWDHILTEIACQLHVRLTALPSEIVKQKPGPPHSTLHPGALETLQQLASPGRAIVLATKGLLTFQRPVLEALNLLPLFDDLLAPDVHYALKQDRAFYGHWPEMAPIQIMVGDHYVDDVLPAHQFGFRTIWKPAIQPEHLCDRDPFARSAAYPYTADQPICPDAIIFSLHELATVVASIDNGT